MSTGSRQGKNKQIEKEPDEENVSLGRSFGVSVQLASLLARWQVQYQAFRRVSPENYKICQLDLGKRRKKNEREKKGEKKRTKSKTQPQMDLSCPSAGQMDNQRSLM